MILVNLLAGGVMGVICAVIANGRGRSAAAWFFIGFLLGCIGIIILLVMPDLRIDEERRSRLLRENRRLRESARKDRMVSDSRHSENQRRFAVHDRALGVDTGSPTAGQIGHDPVQQIGSGGTEPQKPFLGLSGGMKPAAPQPAAGGVDATGHAAKQWYFADTTGGRQGPVGMDVLRSLWQQGSLKATTHVWTEGMADWAHVSSIPGLEDTLNG